MAVATHQNKGSMTPEKQILIRQGKNPDIYPMDHSRLEVYKRCPAQFDFQYNQRLPRTSGDAASLGSVAHDFFEIYINHGLSAAETYVSAMLPLTKTADLKKIQAAITQIKFKGKPYSTERRFHFYAEIAKKTIQFEARIDVLFIYPDQAEVIDGKSGRQVSSNIDNDPQGLFYALACLRSKELSFFNLDSVIFTQAQFQAGKLVTTHFSRADIEKYERYLHACVEEIIADNRFKPKPGTHCHWCPYVASVCPVGKSIAPEFLSLAGRNIKIRATDSEEAQALAEQAMYLDALLVRMKAALRGYMGSTGDQAIETASGQVIIDIVNNKYIRGGTTGILERHPEERNNLTESHYAKLVFKKKE